MHHATEEVGGKEGTEGKQTNRSNIKLVQNLVSSPNVTPTLPPLPRAQRLLTCKVHTGRRIDGEGHFVFGEHLQTQTNQEVQGVQIQDAEVMCGGAVAAEDSNSSFSSPR